MPLELKFLIHIKWKYKSKDNLTLIILQSHFNRSDFFLFKIDYEHFLIDEKQKE
ncbi:hypothetical protein LX97_02039 [Nonlabens dokdonensis]|uniref:Uncharacterized protein n=1 Tax=Nonlabens dokdonensis TaxID=328515 RepID=A0ABX5PWZ8_9FLAO|nr:hypothetical protein LX97_02039 [Nonlabens dokdonensis]